MNMEPKPPSKRRRQNGDGQLRAGDESKQRILAAALQCFADYGFEGASTRMIARLAGVTPPLILYHFDNKESLWIETVHHTLSGFLNSVQNSISDEPARSARDALESFISNFVRFCAKYPEIHRIMTLENKKSDRLKWLIDLHIRPYYGKVCNIIKQGLIEGSVRDGDPSHIFYQIISCGTLFSISYEYEELTGRDIFSETEIDQVIAHVMRITLV